MPSLSSLRYCVVLLCLLGGCATVPTPPPGGWVNASPTVVERVVERGERQLLLVAQGQLRAWVEVPDVGATVGTYVLLGRGNPRYQVDVPELGRSVDLVIDIAHVALVDARVAQKVVSSGKPQETVSIGTVYAELAERSGSVVVVHGTVVKSTNAVGWNWVHLQDGTGDAAAGSHDLTIQTQEQVVRGQQVVFEGTLRQDVSLGFGYHYEALVENGKLLVDR